MRHDGAGIGGQYPGKIQFNKGEIMTTTMTDMPAKRPIAARPQAAPRPQRRKRRTMEPGGLRLILLGVGLMGAAPPIHHMIVDAIAVSRADDAATVRLNRGGTGLISMERARTPGLDVTRVRNATDPDYQGSFTFMPARSGE